MTREEFLKKPIEFYILRDNEGDPNCKTCKGHGCLDDGNEFGCIMIYCPDCYNKKK